MVQSTTLFSQPLEVPFAQIELSSLLLSLPSTERECKLVTPVTPTSWFWMSRTATIRGFRGKEVSLVKGIPTVANWFFASAWSLSKDFSISQRRHKLRSVSLWQLSPLWRCRELSVNSVSVDDLDQNRPPGCWKVPDTLSDSVIADRYVERASSWVFKMCSEASWCLRAWAAQSSQLWVSKTCFETSCPAYPAESQKKFNIWGIRSQLPLGCPNDNV